MFVSKYKYGNQIHSPYFVLKQSTEICSQNNIHLVDGWKKIMAKSNSTSVIFSQNIVYTAYATLDLRFWEEKSWISDMGFEDDVISISWNFELDIFHKSKRMCSVFDSQAFKTFWTTGWITNYTMLIAMNCCWRFCQLRAKKESKKKTTRINFNFECQPKMLSIQMQTKPMQN